jgi:hypothetical protein
MIACGLITSPQSFLSSLLLFHRRFEDAIEVLKAFERKDTQMKAMAATNLSFIYFLEGTLSRRMILSLLFSHCSSYQCDAASRADAVNCLRARCHQLLQ